jgi:transaldolase
MRIELGGNSLYDLARLGQSTWLDCSHRRMLIGSQLARLVREGISGIYSHSIGIAASYAEDAACREVVAEFRAAGCTAPQIYERLRIEDLRRAADHFRRIYRASGRDGYASVGFSPDLAHDSEGIESEARRLWREIDRPNAMVQVPATDAGLVAMRRLIAAGINVNVTLVFGARRYREVADAYLAGLEDRVAERLPLERVASVASVFVSRIDTAVDREIDTIQRPTKAAHAKSLRGRAAVAVAQFIYQRYKSVIASPRWRYLAAHHAQTQRLLWASTGINDANCSDLKYVNALIGRDTVTTMSLDTLNSYIDHGAAAPTLERNLLDVLALFGELEALGIDLDRVSRELEEKGLDTISTGVNTALTRIATK